MSSKKRPSRQDLIRAQQSSTFVGRAEQLDAFERNLSALSVANGTGYPAAFLFNVWGQGGVGKTTLLKQFEAVTKRHRASVDDALADFNRAIELDPEYFWALFQRGRTHLLQRQYEIALLDLNAVTASDDNDVDDWDYYHQGLAHLGLSQTENAKSDLTQAIQLAKAAYEKDTSNHQNTLNLALYYLVFRNLPTAQKLYQAVLQQNPPNGYIQEALQDLQDLLTIFPTYPNAQAMHTSLQTTLEQKQ